MAYQSWNPAQVERFFNPSEVADMQSSLELIFNADAPERKDLLERITPEQLEWYYDHQIIQ